MQQMNRPNVGRPLGDAAGALLRHLGAEPLPHRWTDDGIWRGPRAGWLVCRGGFRLGDVQALHENEVHAPGCRPYHQQVVTKVGQGLRAWAGAVGDRATLATALGAIGVSSSGLFVALSNTSPGTASFFRCVFALPLLAPLAIGVSGPTGAKTTRVAGPPIRSG